MSEQGPGEVRVDIAHDPATGEYVNNGSHGVLVIHSGGIVTRLTPGDLLTPAKDGQAAVVLRTRSAASPATSA